MEKVLALLEADERELRWAAALVLGALRPDAARALPALAKALDSEDQRLRAAALESIAAIGGSEAYENVAPLLEEPGDLGHRAMDVVAGMGAPVMARLKRHFSGAGETGRRRILTIAARLRGAAGVDLIVRALEKGHAAAVLGLADRLEDELAEANPRDRNTLLRRLDKFLNSAFAKSNPVAAGTAVDLLARITGAEAQDRLLEYTANEHPPTIRKRALHALANLAPGGKLSSELLTRVLELLKDRDFANVVAPAMDVLERAKLSAAHAGPLLACVNGEDPALRRFAVTALGQVDTPKSAATLLEILKGDNPDLQSRAAVALSKQSAATPLVAAALASAPTPANAWVLARILQPHRRRLKPEQVAHLAQAVAGWLAPGDPRAEAVLILLRDDHFDALVQANMRKVKRIRKDRMAGEIVNLLRPLLTEDSGPEIRYELALAEVLRGPKEVVREVRLGNLGLQGLEALLHEPEFSLLTRLKRDKGMLTTEEYYLIGCHFAERAYADRSFGGELLRWLVQTFPDESAAQAAAHKLVMEGFPPPPKPRAKKPFPRRKRAPRKTAPKKPAPPRRKPAPPKRKPAPSKKKKAVAKKPVRKKALSRKKTVKLAPKKKAAVARKTAKRAAGKTAKKTKRRSR